MAVIALFLVATILPALASAQRTDVQGSLSADLMFTRIAGHTGTLLGGQAALDVGSGLALGGFGYGMLSPVRILGGALPEDLRMGYGGILARLQLASTSYFDVDGALLLGAGNAQIRAQPIGNQLGSDNFLVFEPRLGVTVPASTPLQGRLGVGYRLVRSVEDLPRLGASDLRGWTVVLTISLGGLR